MKKFTEWLRSKNLDLFNEQDPSSKIGNFRTVSKMSEPTETGLNSTLNDPRYSIKQNYPKKSFPMNLAAVGGKDTGYNPTPYKHTEPKYEPNKEQLSLMIPNFGNPSANQSYRDWETIF